MNAGFSSCNSTRLRSAELSYSGPIGSDVTVGREKKEKKEKKRVEAMAINECNRIMMWAWSFSGSGWAGLG